MNFEDRWELLQKGAHESRESLGGSIAWTYTDRIDETFYLTPEGKRVTMFGFDSYVHRRFLVDAGYVESPDYDADDWQPIDWLDYDENGLYLEDRKVAEVCAEGWVRRSTSLLFDDAPVTYSVKGPPSRLSDVLAVAAGEDAARGVVVNIDFVRLDEGGVSGITVDSLDLDEALQL